jgi:hypothetical protein
LATSALSSLKTPQEMIWIETQASILVIIAFYLLCLWPLAEYYRYYGEVKEE